MLVQYLETVRPQGFEKSDGAAAINDASDVDRCGACEKMNLSNSRARATKCAITDDEYQFLRETLCGDIRSDIRQP